MKCGIAGILRLDGAGVDPADAARADAMAGAIAHRGLAERRLHRDGPLALAIPAGTLATSADGARLALVDGFVANAQSFAPSAAEAALALYARHGADFARHLVGSFAIALWDGAAQRLVLARDRVGVRPLFVTRPRPGLLLFGSELKALLTHPDCPREVDWLGTVARAGLPMRSTPPFSFFHGIDPVAPGELVVADARSGSVESRVYWRLEFSNREDGRNEEEIIAGYREVLATAVDDATSDGVPAALLLSGGIDSIAIAALARERRPETFTVFARSTFSNGDAPLARDAARHLGLANHQVVFGRGAGALTPERWRKIVWMCESPMCRGQHYLKSELVRHARAVRPDLGLLLHGEGSDELIGADTSNWSDHRDDATYDGYIASLRLLQREDLLTFDALAAESLFSGKRHIFNDEALAAAAGKEIPRYPMQRRAIYCLEGLADIVLWREDRQGAWNGLEARAPFLDHRLLEFVAAIPPAAHASLFWRKRILRDAFRGELPDPLRLQRKIPFYAGVDARFTNRALLDVLRAEDGALIREAFGDPERHPVLAPGFIRGFLEETMGDPACEGADYALMFVNLGLLQGMARDVAAQERLRRVESPPLVELGRWDEERIAEVLADPHQAIDPERVLGLGRGVELARPERKGGEPLMWIVVDDEVRYVLDEPDTQLWREVLRRVDGERSLRAVLEEVGVPLEEIRKHLEEALEFGVVAFR